MEDLKRIRVKNPKSVDPSDNMVPVGVFLAVQEVQGPVMIQRYNLYQAVTVNATPATGNRFSATIRAMERAADDSLPPHMRAVWTELAYVQLEEKTPVPDDASLLNRIITGWKNLDTSTKAFLLSVLLVFTAAGGTVYKIVGFAVCRDSGCADVSVECGDRRA